MDSKKILKNFHCLGAESVTIAIIDKSKPKVIHYESSNTLWKKFYFNAKEARLCHIMNRGSELARITNSFTLIWNKLSPKNEESIYLNHKRVELNHTNGISICQNLSENILFCLLFSGQNEDVNFTYHLLKEKNILIKQLLTNNLLNNYNATF